MIMETQSGIPAERVAARTSQLERASDVALVWYVQRRSWEDGGLALLAKELRSITPSPLGTNSMAVLGTEPGKVYTASQVQAVRAELPSRYVDDFPLTGEDTSRDVLEDACRRKDHEETDPYNLEPLTQTPRRRYPASYPAAAFLDLCHQAAGDLAADIERACVGRGGAALDVPFYFPRLWECVAENRVQWILAKRAPLAATETAAKVARALDFARFVRGLVLIIGNSGSGKSSGCLAWSIGSPGTSCIVEVPAGGGFGAFLRAIGRGLGMDVPSGTGNLDPLQCRIQTVLRTGQVTLILDEAQRCFPEGNYRAARPRRLEWINSQLGCGVPIAFVSTAPFDDLLRAIANAKRWDANQFINRAKWRLDMPEQTSATEFEQVSRAMFPGIQATFLHRLCCRIRDDGGGLPVLKKLADLARFNAVQAGRSTPTLHDIRYAQRQISLGDLGSGVESLQDAEQAPCAPPESRLHNRCSGARTARQSGEHNTRLAVADFQADL